MSEVEMKFRLSMPEEFEMRAEAVFGARFGEPRLEEDLYFQRVSRDFRDTGEALRIRRVGSELSLTYKGPRRDKVVKTREEIELPLFVPGEGVSLSERQGAWIRLLTRLGYEPFAEIRKSRRTASFSFSGRTFTLTRDSLTELGEFSEIETLIAEEDELPAAQTDLRGVAARLGLDDSVFASYLTLLLESRGDTFAGSD
ncbi:MAG: class IV adenylate cyclase [Thermoguttaceae bacterium]|jgi:adenylate cyclase class 2